MATTKQSFPRYCLCLSLDVSILILGMKDLQVTLFSPFKCHFILPDVSESPIESPRKLEQFDYQQTLPLTFFALSLDISSRPEECLWNAYILRQPAA